MDLTNYEWGFKLGSPTTSDKHLQWKERMKALEVMVPLEKAEHARQIISETFSPYKKKGEIKKFNDCYLFVGRENEHKSDALAMIYSEMLGRHKFRYSTIEIEQVTTIIKDIDRKVITKHNKVMTIREMILNLPAKEQKLVPSNIFLSVDFVAKAENTWFKNTKGRGGACYYVTFYSWDAGEAVTTAKGLGKYLAHYYGMESVHEYFSADHWEVTKLWKWNKKRQQFDTPEQQHMAANVLYDPTSAMIRAYNQQKFLEEKTDTKGNNQSSTFNINDVNQIGNRNDVRDPVPPPSSEEAKQIADKAMNYAMTLHLSSKNSSSSSSNDNDQGLLQQNNIPPATDLENCNKLLASKMVQKEMDPDLDSMPSVSGKTRKINNLFDTDMASVSSSVTDLTDNTLNQAYHNDDNSIDSNASSLVSDTSINSLQDTDIKDMKKAGMSTDEIKHNISITAARIRMKASQKADRMLALALKLEREQEEANNQNEEDNQSNNSSSSQSSSNCDAADNK